MSIDTTCTTCLDKNIKHTYTCGICHNVLCKKCTEFMEPNFFSFYKSIPADIGHTTYCGSCYDTKVLPAKEAYLEIMERAKKVYVFEKGTKNLFVVKRARLKEFVNDCEDKPETLLRLAFFAAQSLFNAVVEVERGYKKINITGYQTTHYSAQGYPARVDENRLPDDDA